MDYRNVKIKLKYKLVETTGCTNCANYIVDTGITYYIKLRLRSEAIDFGYFNVDDNYTGDTTINNETYLVTGLTSSRLSDIEKFSKSNDISIKYKTTTDENLDGLVINETIENQKYVYYIGGIKYVDDILNNVTSFQFTRIISNIDFINNPYYKDESKQNIISKPKINNDINVERQNIAIMDNFYRLKDINLLNDFDYYGGGSIFNIVSNT